MPKEKSAPSKPAPSKPAPSKPAPKPPVPLREYAASLRRINLTRLATINLYRAIEGKKS